MSPLRHAAAWAAAVAAAASFTAALVHPAELEPLVQRWQSQLAEAMGPARAGRVTAAAAQAQDGSLVRSLPWLLALRAATLCAWLWLLAPMWLAAALQGWAIADIRRASFAASNPALHRFACHGAVAVGGALMVALSLPIALPVASVPAAGLLVALLVACHFAHRPAWRG